MTLQEHMRLRQAKDTRMERGWHWRSRTPDTTTAARVQEATRKARYGHRDWLQWTDRDGYVHVARQSVASLKQALLASGTQYAFTQIGANTGHRMLITWSIGLNMLRWQRRETL